ncbi:MAG: hypothetical protein K9N48_07800, partial [Verrucomicrobia bacterium]|nr:hypothetical protein [Verrucomicrobiota bacterium]
MNKTILTSVLIVSFLCAGIPSITAGTPPATTETAASEPHNILITKGASSLERFAAKELRRYIYLRTGNLKAIHQVDTIPEKGVCFLLSTTGNEIFNNPLFTKTERNVIAQLSNDDFYLKTIRESDQVAHVIAGGSPTAVLYGAYRTAELMGVRFYLHGDVVPETTLARWPVLDETNTPLFELRGILPFHDFPEGPDWWNLDDYMLVLGQLPKLRMNFFGLHTYPEGGPNAEPTVWIGLPEDIAPGTTVDFSYPSSYQNTMRGNWGYSARKTSGFSFGTSALFEIDEFGPDVMRPEKEIQVINRFNPQIQNTAPFLIKELRKTRAENRLLRQGLECPEFLTGKLKELDTEKMEEQRLKWMKLGLMGQSKGAELLNKGFGSRIGYRAEYSMEYEFHRTGAETTSTANSLPVELFPRPDTQEQCNLLFKRTGSLLEQAFTFANDLGIKTCVGTETPLTIPEQVRTHLEDSGLAYDDPMTKQKLYEGIFKRIASAYPIDYYWLWTPENWTWEGTEREQVEDTIADIKIAYSALELVNSPFKLATCGWVLGPEYDRALFDNVLPRDIPVSCINRQVGKDPVDPGFADVATRQKWAIPWLEDDPALTSPQLWAGRMRRDAYDAYRYGCNGLMGIHWRTRIVGPTVSALAEAAWDQDDWAPDEAKDRFLKSKDFYMDWAAHNFGHNIASNAAEVFSKIDGHLPCPSDWVNGPGGIKPDKNSWDDVKQEYAFINELAGLRSQIQGKANLERFDYWLNSFRYMSEIARLRCFWAELNTQFDAIEKAECADKKRDIARKNALPLRINMIETWCNMYRYLLATVSNPGELGTIANWEQHIRPSVIDAPARKLEKVLGEKLPECARIPMDYSGAPRIIVPSKRTSLRYGEDLILRVLVLSKTRSAHVRLNWRTLGNGDYSTEEFRHVARSVYEVRLNHEQFGAHDFEYYITAKFGSRIKSYPVTAP